jgi:hypothetical protein
MGSLAPAHPSAAHPADFAPLAAETHRELGKKNAPRKPQGGAGRTRARCSVGRARAGGCSMMSTKNFGVASSRRSGSCTHAQPGGHDLRLLGVVAVFVFGLGIAGGQDESGSASLQGDAGGGGAVAAPSAGAEAEDSVLPGGVSVWNVAELVFHVTLLSVGGLGLLWHFSTFNEWIDTTIAYAEGAAINTLGAAAGGVSGTIKTAQSGVTTLADSAASAAEMASPDKLLATVGRLASGGTSLTGSDGSRSPRSPRSRSPGSLGPSSPRHQVSIDLALDMGASADAEDIGDSFSTSPRDGAKSAISIGGRTAARGVSEANALATNTVTTGIKVASISANVALAGVDRTVDNAVQGTVRGIEMTNRGRQRVISTTADLGGRVVQKESVRKIGVGAKHRMHVIIDDLVDVFFALPVRWRIVWSVGVLVLLVLGLTVLLVVPFAFTLLIALWTLFVVKLASINNVVESPRGGGESPSGEHSPRRKHKLFNNPMRDLMDIDDLDEESRPRKATQEEEEEAEEVVEFSLVSAGEGRRRPGADRATASD